MRLSYSALFSGLCLVMAAAYSLTVARQGLRLVAVQLPRYDWVSANPNLWQLNWWLWLLFVFSWMVLLATFIWRYTPVHRVATMLQSGLITISAILTIIALLVWMNLLPLALTHPEPADMAQFVDTLALTLLGAGCFMGGIVTTWICLDLIWLKKLTISWLLPGILAGCTLIPSPFLFPSANHILLGGVLWIIWSILLIVRGPEPRPFPELL